MVVIPVVIMVVVFIAIAVFLVVSTRLIFVCVVLLWLSEEGCCRLVFHSLLIYKLSMGFLFLSNGRE